MVGQIQSIMLYHISQIDIYTKIKDLDTNLYIIPIKCGSYDRYQPKGFSYFNGRLCSPVH